VFDKLRLAMRIALPEDKHGINDNGDSADMKSIDGNVTAWRKWLVSDKLRSVWRNDYTARQILGEAFRRFVANGDPGRSPVSAATKDEQHPGTIFSWSKTARRKKSGMASLNKLLQSALAEPPLFRT
jgi:hypothetical protein